MAKKLSEWSKQVKIEMVKRDWGINDLANAVHMSRPYVSAVVNGRVYSAPAVKAISDELNVCEIAYSTRIIWWKKDYVHGKRLYKR